jgi:hypothetical protein
MGSKLADRIKGKGGRPRPNPHQGGSGGDSGESEAVGREKGRPPQEEEVHEVEDSPPASSCRVVAQTADRLRGEKSHQRHLHRHGQAATIELEPPPPLSCCIRHNRIEGDPLPPPSCSLLPHSGATCLHLHGGVDSCGGGGGRRGTARVEEEAWEASWREEAVW